VGVGSHIPFLHIIFSPFFVKFFNFCIVFLVLGIFVLFYWFLSLFARLLVCT